jgi:hypothetical protein
MKEINITNDVINFLSKVFKSNISTDIILKKMAQNGWKESCNDWGGFIELLEKKDLNKIFYEYEFFIRY